MIKKEKFVRILNELERVDRAEEKIVEAISSISAFYWNYPFSTGSDTVIDLLEELTNDEGQMISYFVYELDWGKKWEPGCVTDENEDIDLSTAEKLYDYLEKIYE